MKTKRKLIYVKHYLIYFEKKYCIIHFVDKESKNMMNKKKVKRFTCLLIFVCVLCGCHSTEIIKTVEEKEVQEKVQEEIIVGFSQYVTDWPWMVAQTNSIVSQAKLKDYKLVWKDAGGSLEQQKDDIEELIELGVSYLLVVPGEEFGIEGLVRYANQKGITVISLGRELRTVTDNVICIQSDQRLEGQMAGKWVVEHLGGSGNVVEIQGNLGSSSAKQRNEGFREVIDQYPDIHVLSESPADFTRSGGNDTMVNILRQYSGEVDAVFCHNDEMAIGAIQAIKGVGQVPGKDMAFISVDGEKDALKAIIAGELSASIKCTPFLGIKVFEVIDMLENGQKVEKMYILPTEIVYDEDNAREYINKAY